MTDDVILVDADDREVGIADKLDAHRQGLRHRAISALICNGSGEMLLQRRHPAKYHSGGLWANACCSHPRPGESVSGAARRRLREEMGLDCALEPLFTYSYRERVSNDLIENEVVHVFGGRHDGPARPDPAEVSEWKWIGFDDLVADITANPETYAVWFRQYIAAHGGLIAGWCAQRQGVTMPTEMLILDMNADLYRDRLAPRFPDIAFHAFKAAKDAFSVADRVEVIIGLGHHIPRELIAAAPKLKWVQALTTGVDTLVVPGVLPPDVVLTSTRGIHGPQMTELAFLNMIALQRNFRQMQRNQAEAKWEAWAQPILHGKTIVIVGLGLLAEHLAERCKLFGMTVIGVSGGRSGQVANFDEVVTRGDLVKVAARADFLMLLVPYSPETHHLINRDVIAAMKPTAFLINLARGGVLDEAALIEHLKAGKIAGAGLDIFSKQPLPADNPLWKMPNVIITPNIGGRSNVFVDQTLTIVGPNIAAFKDGRIKDLRNVIAR